MHRVLAAYSFQRSTFLNVKWVAVAFAVPLLLFAGCKGSTQSSGPQQPTARQLQQQQARALAKSEATARVSLAEIPPPSKHLYVNVHSTDGWQNPFLTVHHDTLTLRVIFPQQTSSALDAGTLLHPAAARRQELEIRMSDLPEALAAIPEFSWPYGRVVAIEEAPNASRQDRPQVRRNVEQAIRIVNDLDVVVDEWTPGGTGLLH
ncbi:MAG TPA: hypothetical protein VGY94_08510 [Acidobacteriaceae bacterium]|nr:hypothetical protein [Acidobacteriaceae bacterium]